MTRPTFLYQSKTRDFGGTGEDPSALIVVRQRGTLALEKERASHCVDGPGDNDHGALPKKAPKLLNDVTFWEAHRSVGRSLKNWSRNPRN
jgi:hypothetical protein